MIKKIEPRENEFTLQLQEMLGNAFPLALGYEVVYIIGEDEKGKRGLYFELNSKEFGKLYSKFMIINTLASEIEDEFMNSVINDLVMAGVSLMNIASFNRTKDKSVITEINKSDFRNTLPKRLLFIN
jgi:hypothetical protein